MCSSDLNGLVWHDEDRRILGADRRGYFIDWNVDAASGRWSMRLDGVGVRPAIDAGGEVAFLGAVGGEVVRVALEDGAELARTRLEGLGVRSLALRPAGSRVLVGTLEGWLIALNAQTLEEIERVQRHADRITRTLFSPTGDVLATSSYDGTLALSPADALAAERTIRLGGEGNAWDTDGLDGACFTPDGRLLAVASNSWLIRLIDVASGDVVIDLEGHRDWVRRVAFSPDGGTLVSTGSYASVRVWDTRSTPDAERAFAARVDLDGVRAHQDQELQPLAGVSGQQPLVALVGDDLGVLVPELRIRDLHREHLRERRVRDHGRREARAVGAHVAPLDHEAGEGGREQSLLLVDLALLERPALAGARQGGGDRRASLAEHDVQGLLQRGRAGSPVLAPVRGRRVGDVVREGLRRCFRGLAGPLRVAAVLGGGGCGVRPGMQPGPCARAGRGTREGMTPPTPPWRHVDLPPKGAAQQLRRGAPRAIGRGRATILYSILNI